MKMMKTLFKLLLVGFLAIGLTAASASATSISFGTTVEITGALGVGTDTSAGRTIALEAVTGATAVAGYYTVDLDDAVVTPADVAAAGNPLTAAGDKIGIETSWGMNSGDIITLTFTNALYMGATAFLYAEEVAVQQPNAGTDTDFNADADELDVVEIASNFGTLDAVNGVSQVVLRVNNGVVLPTGMQLHFVVSLPANAIGGITDDVVNPVLKILPSVTSGSVVNIAMSAVTSGGVTIGAAACNQNILSFLTQFTFGITAGTSTIDVEAVAGNRWNFVEEGAAADVLTTANDTDLTISGAVYTFSNVAGCEDFITLGADDSLVVTLTSSTDLTEVDHVNNTSGLEIDDNQGVDGIQVFFGTPTATTLTATITGTQLVVGAIAGVALNTMIGDNYITIEGNGIVNARTWTTGAVLNIVEAGFLSEAPTSTTAPVLSHTWATNGSQFVIPHMFSRNGWETYAVLKSQYNQSSSSVTVDLLARDGSYAPNLVFGTVLPASTGTGADDGGSLYISAAELMTLAGWTASGLTKDFSAVFTLTVPNDQIQADAYRYSDGQFFNATLYQKKNFGGGAVTAQWEK